MGNRNNRSESEDIPPLSPAVIRELCQSTGFSEEELLGWHVNFYKDCPDGRLTFKQFEHEYSKMMGRLSSKTADYVRHMFNVYDQDKNQYIDFKEFVMALSAASAANRVRLVETLFHIFDLDNDGRITKDEMSKMLSTLVDVTDSSEPSRKKQNNLQLRIDEAFNELNANDDDHITKEEFVDWYMRSGLLSDLQVEDFSSRNTLQTQNVNTKQRQLGVTPSYHGRPNQEHEEVRRQNSHLARHFSRMIERKTKPNCDDDDDDDDDENKNRSDLTRPSDTHNDDTGDDIKDTFVSTLTTTIANGNRAELPSSHSASQPHFRIEDDIEVDNEETSKRVMDEASKHSSDDGAYSAERWQYLFNSVMDQMRTQRSQQQAVPSRHTNRYQTRRVDVEEEAPKSKHQKQKFKGRVNPSYESTTNIASNSSRQIKNDRPPSPDVYTIRL